jgi:hypothetical protein
MDFYANVTRRGKIVIDNSYVSMEYEDEEDGSVYKRWAGTFSTTYPSILDVGDICRLERIDDGRSLEVIIDTCDNNFAHFHGNGNLQ